MQELYQKLWRIRSKVPVLRKESEGFNFKYVSLEDIESTINPICEAEGIGYYQKLDIFGEGQNGLVTTIFSLSNDSSETIVTAILIPKDVSLKGQNSIQSIGSAITYYRRYALAVVFGLLGTDRDVDAIERTSSTSNETPTAEQTTSIDYVAKVNELIKLGRSKEQITKYLALYRGKMGEDEIPQIESIINSMS